MTWWLKQRGPQMWGLGGSVSSQVPGLAPGWVFTPATPATPAKPAQQTKPAEQTRWYNLPPLPIASGNVVVDRTPVYVPKAPALTPGQTASMLSREQDRQATLAVVQGAAALTAIQRAQQNAERRQAVAEAKRVEEAALAPSRPNTAQLAPAPRVTAPVPGLMAPSIVVPGRVLAPPVDEEGVVAQFFALLTSEGVIAAASFLANFLLGLPDVGQAISIINKIRQGKGIDAWDVVILALTALAIAIALLPPPFGMPGVFLPLPSIAEGIKSGFTWTYELVTDEPWEDPEVGELAEGVQRLMERGAAATKQAPATKQPQVAPTRPPPPLAASSATPSRYGRELTPQEDAAKLDAYVRGTTPGEEARIRAAWRGPSTRR